MSPLRAWDRFWFGPVSARPLGAFRIAFGLIALEHLALLAVDLDHWLTDAGLLAGADAQLLAGPLRPSPLHGIGGPVAVRAFVAALAAVAALVAVGWRTRITTVLLYLGLLAIHHRNLATASSADVLLVVLAFDLMLSPCGAALSLDARRAARRRGTPAEPLIEPWAQRLIQIQLTAIYLLAALAKLDGMTWSSGTALHYALGDAEMCRYSFNIKDHELIGKFLTFGALVAEAAIPPMLWRRATRPAAIALGLALHGGIVLTINIPVFGELMAACYLTFLAPGELAALGRRLAPPGGLVELVRGGRRRPGQSSVGTSTSSRGCVNWSGSRSISSAAPSRPSSM